MKFTNELSTFETERLILRPFNEKDIDASYQLNLDEEVSRYTGDGGVVSYEEMERRIRQDVMGDYSKFGIGRYAVILKSTSKFIGFSGLKYLPGTDEIDLGYRFHKENWGQGIATESGRIWVDLAFQTLDLKNIVASLLPENIGSIRVLEKLGFTFQKSWEEDDMLIHQYILENPR